MARLSGSARRAALCSIACALALRALAADDKTLRVGMDTRAPPWSFVEGLDFSREDQASDPTVSMAQLARVQGFDVDVARLVAKRLGTKLEIVPVAWGNIENGLVASRYDAIIDAWTPTARTSAAIVATSPYWHWGLLVVVRAADSRIRTFQDLGGLRVGHYDDPAVLRSLSALGHGAFQTFDDPGSLFDALKEKRLDAAIFDSPYVEWWMSRNPGYRLVGEPLNRLGYHIGVRKADAELARKLEAIAASLEGSPELAEIRKRWGGR